MAWEENTLRLYYQVQEDLQIPIDEKGDCGLWQRDYAEISNLGWDVRSEGLLKVLVYPGEKEYQILLIAHHLLCDGRGLLQLTEEFAQHYVKGIMPLFVEERLIQSLEDMPPRSGLPFISKIIIGDANKKWIKEGHQVSYEEYAEFEKDYIKNCKVTREITTVASEKLEEIHRLCKQQGISINDYLIADMMQREHVDKVLIAADIREKLSCYRRGAMGNYSTAFSVVIHKQPEDLMALAKLVAAKVSDIRKCSRKEMLVLACYLEMRPELLDAVPIATLGAFESKAAAFVGVNMFGYGARNGHSITNLGKMESDVIEEAVFIPPVSPANKKIAGVLTVNNQMKICEVSLVHA